MAFTWIVSRIIRLFGQKTNALFYLLTYRELQAQIVELAKAMDVAPDMLAKEIGRRAARESAQRHASVLSIVPINPNSPEQIKKYIEVLWFVLFGKEMRDYTVRVDDDTPGRQRLTFLLKTCPICMGHEEDVERYKELYKTFSGGETEGYACMMAGMLEDLARIIMENKGLDIRIIVTEKQCFARGDGIMAVESQVVPVEEYEARRKVALSVARSVQQPTPAEAVESGFVQVATQSTKLFAKVYEQLNLERLDTFFENPNEQIKTELSQAIEKQLHFQPKEILAYFQNYEEDIFRVIGYLTVHALNEAGGIIQKAVESYLMSKIIDILLSAIEYGLETYIPEKIAADNKQIVEKLVDGWAHEDSVAKIKAMDAKSMFKLVLEGARLALSDYGQSFTGAKEATWTLLKKTNLLQEEGEAPSKSFNLIFDIVQEGALLAGYIMAMPIKAWFSSEYEAIKTPVTSAQEIYQSSREHLEKLFDLIEEFQTMDRSTEEEKDSSIRKAFPRIF
ncbi:MAG: hypothetical protein JW839_10780 [Candidatus Lokiarchaeota archaeon]|nr:hypothetical protein [Candidatus Lokiarchaeota archaeon]